MSRMGTFLLAGWFCAVGAGAQAASVQPVSGGGERIESGVVHTLYGKAEKYRIRLLPITSFPNVPLPVAAQLDQRGCMIPQSFEAQGPENVIHGDFRAAGSSDWAVLCSVRGRTTLYVFFAGRFATPIALRSQADTAWLGADPGRKTYGSAWGIAVRPLSEMEESPELQVPPDLDHEAIDDARLERWVTIRYYDRGKWTVLNPGKQGEP
jgi:hypothetical protein